MFDIYDMNFESSDQTMPAGPYIPEAGECLRCGLCVSVCPTFKLFETDAETPRRRIRTISKLLVENEPVSQDELDHLDNCLQCRACETICPSRMAYGDLFDATLAQLQPERPKNRLTELAFWLIAHKRARNLLIPFLSLYLKSGLQELCRRSGLLGRLNLSVADSLLNMPALANLSRVYPVRGRRPRGRVGLFTGCLAEHFDRDTHLAAIKCLNAIGYEVVIPERQSCCGAMHQHNGRSAQALADNNIATFYALEVDAVIHTATGCGATLQAYRSEDEEKSGWFRRYVWDINAFLLAHWPQELRLAASNLKVAVHEPCSQRNVLKNSQVVFELLGKIPGLKVFPLADNSICCGAGGSYMLTHPQNAEQLKSRKQLVIRSSEADLVVSSNFGCAYYLNADATDTSLRMLHPIQLLADRL